MKLLGLGRLGFYLLLIPSFGYGNCLLYLKQLVVHTKPEVVIEKNESLKFLETIVSRLSPEHSVWWQEVTTSIAQGDEQGLTTQFATIPLDATPRFYRLLAEARELGFSISVKFNNEINKNVLLRNTKRAQKINITGDLRVQQMRDLTYMLQMVGIRQSKLERLFEKAKGKLGLESKELIPMIQPGKAENFIGDEVRKAVDHYNAAIKKKPQNQTEILLQLQNTLFTLYRLRAEQPLNAPWFVVDGKSQSLSDFINNAGYYQPLQSPNNKWMPVGRIDKELVQNPFAKSQGLAREMWWNRLEGVHAIGSVRISRNIKVHDDGKEEVISVEVLHKGEDGNFVPYLFEQNNSGSLELIKGEEARRKTTSCFACHFRLTGVFFGGISQPGYIAAPNWYINAIDYTRGIYHRDFNGLVKEMDPKPGIPVFK